MHPQVVLPTLSRTDDISRIDKRLPRRFASGDQGSRLHFLGSNKTRRKSAITTVATLLLTFGLAWGRNKPQPGRITNGPVVQDVKGATAEIAWSTDAEGSSIVKYGTSPNDLKQTAEAPWGGGKEPNGDYNHTVWLKNLKPNSNYYYRVETTQGAGTGTQSESQPKEFHTATK